MKKELFKTKGRGPGTYPLVCVCGEGGGGGGGSGRKPFSDIFMHSKLITFRTAYDKSTVDSPMPYSGKVAAMKILVTAE